MIGEVNLYCSVYTFDTTFDVYHLDKCTMFINHSNVHCVEADSKAALKDDKTFDVYHAT